MNGHARLEDVETILVYAVYSAPHGSPAPYAVKEWRCAPGHPAIEGQPIYAATEDAAHATVPRVGLVWRPRTNAPAEAPNLIGTWEPAG